MSSNGSRSVKARTNSRGAPSSPGRLRPISAPRGAPSTHPIWPDASHSQRNRFGPVAGVGLVGAGRDGSTARQRSAARPAPRLLFSRSIRATMSPIEGAGSSSRHRARRRRRRFGRQAAARRPTSPRIVRMKAATSLLADGHDHRPARLVERSGGQQRARRRPACRRRKWRSAAVRRRGRRCFGQWRRGSARAPTACPI